MNELVNGLDNCAWAFFPWTDCILEKMSWKEFDFDVLMDVNNLETMPDELLAMLDDMCDILAPLIQETSKEHLLQAMTHWTSPRKPTSFPLSPSCSLFTFPHDPPLLSFSLELGNELGISIEIGSLATACDHV